MVKVKYKSTMLIRMSRLLVFIAHFVFANVSFGEMAVVCDEPEGFVIDNSKIKLLDFDCEKNDGLCGFVISAPLKADDREFQLFVLRKVGEDSNTVMQLNLESTGNNANVETSLYGTKQQMKGVEVHAVYERKKNCALHSIWKFDNKY